MEFDHVVIDLGGKAFVANLLYVAITRCKCLSGITFVGRKLIAKDFQSHMKTVEFIDRECTRIAVL